MPETIYKRKTDNTNNKAAFSWGKIKGHTRLTLPQGPARTSSHLLGPRTQAHKCCAGFLCLFLSLCLTVFSHFSAYTIWKISIIKTSLEVTQRANSNLAGIKTSCFRLANFEWDLAHLHIICTFFWYHLTGAVLHKSMPPSSEVLLEDGRQPIVKLNLIFPKTVKLVTSRTLAICSVFLLPTNGKSKTSHIPFTIVPPGTLARTPKTSGDIIIVYVCIFSIEVPKTSF